MSKNLSLQPSDHPAVWHPCRGPYKPATGDVVNIMNKAGIITSDVWDGLFFEGEAYWSRPLPVKRNRKKGSGGVGYGG